MTKRCNACGSRKRLDKFNNCKSASDGKQPWCRECQAEYNAEYLAPSRRGRKGKKDPWYSSKIRDTMRVEIRRAIFGKVA